jgi:hypothetical protein
LQEKGGVKMKPKLVVYVLGGIVQDVWSNVPAEVLILDCDEEMYDRTKEIRDWDFKNQMPLDEMFRVFDTRPWDPPVEAGAVDHFFSEMDKEGGETSGDEVVSEVQRTEGAGE